MLTSIKSDTKPNQISYTLARVMGPCYEPQIVGMIAIGNSCVAIDVSWLNLFSNSPASCSVRNSNVALFVASNSAQCNEVADLMLMK